MNATENEPIESASRDELTALQLERLRLTLARAYDRVPSYRTRFDAAGVTPGDFRDLGDLERFPFISKVELRDAYPFGMLAVPREQLIRLHASSGTTGAPTVVGYTRGDIETWAGLIARSIRAAGGRPGDILHNAYGYGLFTGGLGFHHGAELFGCTCVPISGGMTERQVQLIRDFRPDIITVTPSYALALADEMERQGMGPESCSLRIGLHGAEPWSEAMRTEIEGRFGMHALNHYGLSEVTGPGVASECVETKDGPTIWEDHFYPEVVDPATGAPVPDGEQGELVLTTLTREAMPMVRFRTRDLTRLLPPTARAMRRIDRIAGRTDDMLIIRGVNLFPTQIESVILDHDALSPHYFLEVRREGRLDALDVVVEARRELAGGGRAGMSEAGRRLAHDVRSRFGIGVGVRVLAPGEVERSIGKARRVVDLRSED